MKPLTKSFYSLLAGMTLFSAHSQAAVLFSDDFSSSGSGTGWATSTSWEDGKINTGTVAVSGGNLTLTSQGSGNVQTLRSLDTTIAVAGSDFWLVTDIAYGGTKPANAAWFGIAFFATGGSESMFFGADSASTDWEITTDGSDATSTVAAYSSSSTLLVAHITGTQVDMWINPSDTSSAAALGAATKSVSNNPIVGATSWDRVRFGAGVGSNGTEFSEITMGNLTAATTFAEAIPEPSTSLLAVLASSLCLLRRRRA